MVVVNKFSPKLKWIGIFSIILVLAVGIYLKYRSNSDNINNMDSTSGAITTTSESESAQSDYTNGDYREPGNTLNENRGYAKVYDTDGEQSPNKQNYIGSDSGEIKVYSPLPNSKVDMNQLIFGDTNLQKINYRIIDNISGVIASGELIAKNGSFSGKVTFNTNASEGRIDIYSTKTDGTEYNNIEIPIRF